MEHILGSSQGQGSSNVQRGARELGEDAAEADKLSEATKDVARARYQRLFWEPVVEGKVSSSPQVNWWVWFSTSPQDPTMSAALAKATADGVASTKAKEAAALSKLRGLKMDTEPDVVIERAGRPTIRFVDAGVKFIDVKDRLKRQKVANRRALLRTRRELAELRHQHASLFLSSSEATHPTTA